VRRRLLLAALAFAWLLLPAQAPAQAPAEKRGPLDKLVDKAPDKECKEGCSRHGTKIDFYKSPTEAAAAAKKEEKLVLVLHVSGLFEDPKLT
jgi:hypothetical protein